MAIAFAILELHQLLPFLISWVESAEVEVPGLAVSGALVHVGQGKESEDLLRWASG